MTELVHRHCRHEADITAFSLTDINQWLIEVPNWNFDNTKKQITRSFKFADFKQTIAFVNASVWIINEQDHHPKIDINYNQCRFSFSTHSVHGISIKDFICAAKIDQLTNEIVD